MLNRQLQKGDYVCEKRGLGKYFQIYEIIGIDSGERRAVVRPAGAGGNGFSTFLDDMKLFWLQKGDILQYYSEDGDFVGDTAEVVYLYKTSDTLMVSYINYVTEKPGKMPLSRITKFEFIDDDRLQV